MGISNKLCNPTPFKALFNYGAGTVITVEPFSAFELHYTQMEDFVPSKPGWPVVKEDLEFKGLFVLDPDRPYDNQALEAIQKTRKIKEERFRAGKEEMKNNIAKLGLQFSEENLVERLERAGYMRLKKEVEDLLEQETFYKTIITAEDTSINKKHILDPKRTVFIMDPPREFPSQGAMHYFLNRPENAGVKARHEEFLERATEVRASTPDKKPKQVNA